MGFVCLLGKKDPLQNGIFLLYEIFVLWFRYLETTPCRQYFNRIQWFGQFETNIVQNSQCALRLLYNNATVHHLKCLHVYLFLMIFRLSLPWIDWRWFLQWRGQQWKLQLWWRRLLRWHQHGSLCRMHLLPWR